MKVTNNW